MKLRTQFGFHYDTSNLPYRKKSMHMFPEKFPSLEYKNLLSDFSDSESEVSLFNVLQNISMYVDMGPKGLMVSTTYPFLLKCKNAFDGNINASLMH